MDTQRNDAVNPITVGIREFRQRLADYLLASDQPVAVTRHGQTVGYFIPVRAARADLDRVALKEAAAQMDGLVRRAGLGESPLDVEMRNVRTRRKTSRRARPTPP